MPKARLLSIREFAAEVGLTYRQVVYRIGTNEVHAEKYNWSPMIPEGEIGRIQDEAWFKRARKTVAVPA